MACFAGSTRAACGDWRGCQPAKQRLLLHFVTCLQQHSPLALCFSEVNERVPVSIIGHLDSLHSSCNHNTSAGGPSSPLPLPRSESCPACSGQGCRCYQEPNLDAACSSSSFTDSSMQNPLVHTGATNQCCMHPLQVPASW